VAKETEREKENNYCGSCMCAVTVLFIGKGNRAARPWWLVVMNSVFLFYGC
jgi:hypothetical protein